MNCFFNIFVCFFLVVFQTTVICRIPLFTGFYDLLCPFIIYLCVYRSLKESIPAILLFGFIMDSISGGPFGLYLTSYMWIFAGVRWIITFLHIRNSPLLLFIVAAAVFVQNLIFTGSILMVHGISFYSKTLNNIGFQVLWAIFTGPFILLAFKKLYTGWDKKIEGITVNK